MPEATPLPPTPRRPRWTFRAPVPRGYAGYCRCSTPNQAYQQPDRLAQAQAARFSDTVALYQALAAAGGGS